MIQNFINKISPIDMEKEYIIFDIGSRDCQQSIEFYQKFPKSKIYSFECNPNTLPICKKNIESYSDRISLIEGAVCDYDGEIKFYPINQEKTVTTWKDGNPGASSIYKSNGTYTVEKYVQDEITTNCHRLDSVMKKYDISRVDIIWIDLQGAELLALKSLGDHIKNVKYIHTEVSHKPIYTGQVMFNELNEFIKSHGFNMINSIYGKGWQEDAIYEKQEISMARKIPLFTYFDIIIPVGPNDVSVIHNQLSFTKKNIVGYRNIYLITPDSSLSVEGCITINESIFPFSIDTVAKYHGSNERNGWYLQQLLKLYAGFIIPDIAENYLVIDADTFFLKPTSFIHDNKPLYNVGLEYHIPYFTHMAKLDKSFNKMTRFSGICHHMLFNKNIIKEIIDKVENNHADLFYNIFLKCVTEFTGSGASEYEIYFNYLIQYHRDKIFIRELKWKNVTDFVLQKYNGYDYISYHHYMRT